MISQELKTWGEEGEYITFGSNSYKMFVRQFGDENASSAKTLLLIHGFPESSYSYHGIVDGMLKTFDR
ncbi:MAG TPA: hypothetical protein DCR04_12940, partial [Flavobacteriales bacterium]|nr:hypothetical protein [Flavobacteriales bacterium]